MRKQAPKLVLLGSVYCLRCGICDFTYVTLSFLKKVKETR